MAVRVMRVDDDCTPLKDAFVDIWHTDAGGVYSGYPGQLGGLDTSGQTFLRGTQITDADGVALFDTIYPRLVPQPYGPYPLQGPLQEQYLRDLPVLLP